MAETFQDVMAEISQGKPLDLEAEERVTPEDTPGQEKPEDKPVGEPESEAEEATEEETPPKETEPEKDGDPVSQEPTDEGDEPEEPEGESAEEATEEEEEEPEAIELDGEKVTLDQVREWKNDGLRQADYSNKTMETAKLKRELLEEKQALKKLAEELADDGPMRQFIAAHPEALGHVFARPDAARKLLGDAKAVETFWKEYDVIVENPNLAARLLESPDDGEAEIRAEDERQTMVNVLSSLDQFVDYVGQQAYPDVDADQVKKYVASLAAMPEDPTHEQQVEGVQRLFGLFFRRQDDGQWTIDHQLISSEYERQKNALPAKKEEEEPDVEAHNATVDEQLQSGEKPPKTPDGTPPAAEGERQEIPGDFQGILQKLQSGGSL